MQPRTSPVKFARSSGAAEQQSRAEPHLLDEQRERGMQGGQRLAAEVEAVLQRVQIVYHQPNLRRR